MQINFGVLQIDAENSATGVIWNTVRRKYQEFTVYWRNLIILKQLMRFINLQIELLSLRLHKVSKVSWDLLYFKEISRIVISEINLWIIFWFLIKHYIFSCDRLLATILKAWIIRSFFRLCNQCSVEKVMFWFKFSKLRFR